MSDPSHLNDNSAAANVELTIEKMVYGGDGLARTPEGVVLVSGVLAGERATVRLDEQRQGVRRGHVVELLSRSVNRTAADCPYYGRCGGCQYQHTSYERQLEIKEGILAECLERIGKIRLEVPMTRITAEPWRYRNRSRLRIEKGPDGFRMGYYEHLSHRLCAIESCPISSPGINAAIKKLAEGLGDACFPAGEMELELVACDSKQTLLATVYGPGDPPGVFGDALMSGLPGLDSVAWQDVRSRREKVWGSGFISYPVGEYCYRVSHGSFFQTNRFLAENLIRAALGDARGSSALDIYAGVGFFSIPLAHRFERVAAVEGDSRSAGDLASNIGVVHPRVRSWHQSAERFLATASEKWDLILADPPRSGLTKAVRERVLRLRPARFVYVSCDPATLARDLGDIMRSGSGRSGYRIESVSLIDQFPQTYHLETVVHLAPN